MNDFTEGAHFPGTEWDHADPRDAGIDPERLQRATDAIFAIEKRYGFLVAQGGRIVHEHYARGPAATNPIFSVTKGWGATLVGVAEAKGLLSVDDPVRDWLPVHHPDIAKDATLLNLLNMTAGREPAGSWWQYNSNEILNSLTGIVWLASGMPPVEFFRQYLKIPMQLSFDWPANPRGWIQIGSQGPLPVIEATHRDIARLGLLWLRGGNWRGQPLLRPEFVARGLTPPYPGVNSAYGFLWWLNSAAGTWRTTGARSGTGRWFPNAPENLFLALGARGKVMVILPDDDLVAVTMGDTPQEQSADYLDVIVRNVVSLRG